MTCQTASASNRHLPLRVYCVLITRVLTPGASWTLDFMCFVVVVVNGWEWPGSIPLLNSCDTAVKIGTP